MSPGDREPPDFRRAVPLRPGRPRSSSREKAYSDSQRDVNEGTINVLRSMHAKLMTMQGQTGKLSKLKSAAQYCFLKVTKPRHSSVRSSWGFY